MTIQHRSISRRAVVLGSGVAALGVTLGGAVVPAVARGDKDCGDFKTQKKAQKFFKKHGGPKKDPHNLDADNDGKACEELP